MNLICPGDNPDITKERLTATFDMQKMAAFIYGGEGVVQRRKEIREFVESVEEFRDPIPVEFMDREMRVDNAARKTELAHGTNLSALETTATYDPKTEEFVLRTPSLKAAKWWPGGMAKSANYAVVIANMFIHGESKGPHGFMCQLRDLENHKVLPGIQLGDIGPKLGMNGSDNGYLIFTRDYRIPRKQMLMRNAKMSEGVRT